MHHPHRTLGRKALGFSALLAISVGMVGCGSTGSIGTTDTINTFAGDNQTVTSTASFEGTFGQEARTEEYVPHQIIVKSKEGTAHKLSSLFTLQGTKVLKSFVTNADGAVYRLIEVSDSLDLNKAMQAYAGSPDTDRFNGEPVVQRNLKMNILLEPNDPMFKDQWSLPRVKAPAAWDVTIGSNSNLVVGVVDTGIDYNHPDLSGSVVKGPNLTGEGDQNDPIDGFGHGTHVAGIIMAHQNNGTGVTGVAPGVKAMAIRVLSSKGGGNLFSIAAGIKYAVDNGCKIVNLSLGGPPVKDVISSAIGYYATQKKGALLVAAAGNNGGPVGTPARIRDYYMAVAASNEADDKASFSNFGPELSIISPGTKILNTTPTYDAPINKLGYPKNYASLNGTSMAAPLVAGAAALVWSKNPGWTYVQVRKELERTAFKIGNGDPNLFGNGRLDVGKAIAR